MALRPLTDQRNRLGAVSCSLRPSGQSGHQVHVLFTPILCNSSGQTDSESLWSFSSVNRHSAAVFSSVSLHMLSSQEISSQEFQVKVPDFLSYSINCLYKHSVDVVAHKTTGRHQSQANNRNHSDIGDACYTSIPSFCHQQTCSFSPFNSV